MAFPTDGYSPDQATYQLQFVDLEFNGTTMQIVAPAWSQLPGWQDALEAAVLAFRDSILTSMDGVAAQVNRSLTAVTSGPVS